MYLQAAELDHSLDLKKREETSLQRPAKAEDKGRKTQRSEEPCPRIPGRKWWGQDFNSNRSPGLGS